MVAALMRGPLARRQELGARAGRSRRRASNGVRDQDAQAERAAAMARSTSAGPPVW
jgi:hypothetical protein